MPYTRVTDPEKLRRLMASVLMITGDVELPDLLRHLVEEACSLVDARYGALGVLNVARTGLEQFVTVGLAVEEEAAIGARPTGRGVLGLLITDPAALRLEHIGSHPHSFGFPAHHPPMESFLGVPVRIRDEVYGNLYLADKIGDAQFSDEDEALAEALALAAGIAIQTTRLHDRVRVLSLLDDRDRIARDLHDRVIQRIYATGMALQTVAHLPDIDLIRQRVTKAITDMDTTISEIRTAIFELSEGPMPGGVRQAVVRLCEELTPTLGTRVDVSFGGTVDNRVSEPVADHVLAAIREGLVNAAKYSHATRFEVDLTVGDDLTLQIADNGVGFDVGASTAGLGLENLRRRAEKLRGSFAVTSSSASGTRLVWRVPL